MERRRLLASPVVFRGPVVIAIFALLLSSCAVVGGIGAANCSAIMSGHAVHEAATQRARATQRTAAHDRANLASTVGGAGVAAPTDSPPPPVPTRSWSNAAGWHG